MFKVIEQYRHVGSHYKLCFRSRTSPKSVSRQSTVAGTPESADRGREAPISHVEQLLLLSVPHTSKDQRTISPNWQTEP